MVGLLASGPSADRTFAKFIVGPIVGLFLNIDLDELASHLVTQDTGDGFQLRKLCPPRKSVRIKFPRQFPSDLAQARVKFSPDFRSILTHFRDPLQVAVQNDREPASPIGKIACDSLAVQTMSCAPEAFGGSKALAGWSAVCSTGDEEANSSW